MHIEKPTHRQFVDIEGQKIGRLTVVGYAGTKVQSKRRSSWHCRCDCGRMVIVAAVSLRANKHPTLSCGCLQKEKAAEHCKSTATHGRHGSKVYVAWRGMMSRCYSRANASYPHYGGRGIRVANQWHSFTNFYRDMGDPPSKESSLDRIDPNGNYECGNVRWATATIQANNKRNNLRITFNGRSQTLAEWRRELGLTKSFVRHRRDKGESWDSIFQATEIPANV